MGTCGMRHVVELVWSRPTRKDNTRAAHPARTPAGARLATRRGMTRVAPLCRALGTAALVLLAAPVAAAPFDWTFTGVVADAPDGFALPRLGAPMTLQVRVDDAALNTCGTAGGGVYNALQTTRLRMDGLVFSRPRGTSLEVDAPDGACGVPDPTTGVTLRYVNGTGADGWTTEAGVWPPSYLDRVVAGFAWDGPSTIPGPLDRAIADAYIYVFLQGRGNRPVVGRVDRVRIESVPEPALLATMVLVSGASVAAWRRRRHGTRPSSMN